jgi:3-hydroxyacyl-[acyl-carrier-protein] dehydratase
MREILEQIPHRYPFLLIDRILERETGVRVRAEKLLSMGDACLQGHFPGQPVLPGVMMLEMLAQAAAFLEGDSLIGRPIFLAQVSDARFKASAFPGDRLEVEVKPDASFGALKRVKGTVRCEGRVLCTALLVLSQGPQPRVDA